MGAAVARPSHDVTSTATEVTTLQPPMNARAQLYARIMIFVGISSVSSLMR
jgi:hypothetical protein